MNIHCFTSKEYMEALRVNFFKLKHHIEFEYVTNIFNDCLYWENKISALNYFLSLAIEKIEKEKEVTTSLIDYVYSLEETMNFSIQEITLDFLNTLFESYNLNALSIEEKLIETQKVIDA